MAAARTRQVPLGIALTGAVPAPLGWLASTGAAMPEVGVVERSAAMLVHHGELYQSAGRWRPATRCTAMTRTCRS